MARTQRGKLRGHQQSKTWIWRLQLPLSLVMPSERFNPRKSTFICLSQVLLSLSRLLLPSTIMLSTLLTGAPRVFLYTCPNHLNLFSRVFPEIGATPSLSINSWFLIRSINVCPHIHLDIHFSVTSILCSKIFLTGQNLVPYSIAGLIAVR